MSPSKGDAVPGADEYNEHLLAQFKAIISLVCEHLETQAFPFGRPQHGLSCECDQCKVWGDLQHARLAINDPKAPDIELNPYCSGGAVPSGAEPEED